ncbi:MAG: hypothetical protein HY542_04105 [Deltaproteobacteria bacterium]|nr:hypothetical protein [Deltaproteobacteria bacterium]
MVTAPKTRELVVEEVFDQVMAGEQCSYSPLQTVLLDLYRKVPSQEGVNGAAPRDEPANPEEAKRQGLEAALRKFKAVAADPSQLIPFVRSVQQFAGEDADYLLIRSAEFLEAGTINLREVLELSRLAYRANNSFSLVADLAGAVRKQDNGRIEIGLIREIGRGANPIDRMMSVRNLVAIGFRTARDLQDFFRMTDSLDPADAKEFFSALPELTKGLRVRNEKEFQKIKQNLAFLLSYGRGRFADIRELVSSLELNLSHFELSTIGTELGRRYTKIVERGWRPSPEQTRNIAKVISHLDAIEVEKRGSFQIRFSFSRELSDRATYLLIANGGRELNPSVLGKIWRDRKVADIDHWIHRLDPYEERLKDFMLNLCSQGQSEILRGDVAYFVKKAISMLSSEEGFDHVRLVQTARWFISFFGYALKVGGDDVRRTFALFLDRQYERGRTARTIFPQRVFGYMIALYTTEFSLDRYAPRLKGIAKEMGGLDPHKIPRDRWIQNNTMTSRLYFYEQEWFKETVKMMKGKYGWKEDSDYKEKEKIDGLVLSKTVNGVTLRSVLTIARRTPQQRVSEINSGKYAIFVHRGHNSTDEISFPLNGGHITAKGVLIFNGACQTDGIMMREGFENAYGNNFFIADSNTGEGYVNTELLDKLMVGVARGRTDWEFLRDFERHGILLPDNPAFGLTDFIGRAGGGPRPAF